MRIQTRIFLGILVVVVIGISVMVVWVSDSLEPEYRKATEEPLVDASRVLASLAAASAQDGKIDVEMFRAAFKDVHSRKFSAQVFDFTKTSVDYRVYMTDASGLVIFDSENGESVGRDYSQWRDVLLSLQGGYGARTSHEDHDNLSLSTMYVASPIIVGDEVIGVVSVGKPTKTANLFTEKITARIVWAGALIGLVVIFVGMLLSRMVTVPIRKLMRYARAIRDGERPLRPLLGTSEMNDLGTAFEEMRDALEGKKYVEQYVQTLTHEIKSPVSAIRGAAELLREDVPEPQRARFLDNIDTETSRINTVVEKLLLLSSLESKKNIDEVEVLDLGTLFHEVQESMAPLFESRKLTLKITSEDNCRVLGDKFLIRQAMVNLIQNAVEFSASGGHIDIRIAPSADGLEFTVRDHGPGIPDYALPKIFDRFYSLKRPDTGRKSSGLGLALVKEVAHLHHGDIRLINAETGGVEASLILPSMQD
ncbi:MAG: two-component system sensor histidine kinase CreC [Proteobacteria bacterium]|nr:two-component system sensor histidine kinase CreC [Pseudomonadota bacterium]